MEVFMSKFKLYGCRLTGWFIYEGHLHIANMKMIGQEAHIYTNNLVWTDSKTKQLLHYLWKKPSAPWKKIVINY